jgi:hypothetical protein
MIFSVKYIDLAVSRFPLRDITNSMIWRKTAPTGRPSVPYPMIETHTVRTAVKMIAQK